MESFCRWANAVGRWRKERGLYYLVFFEVSDWFSDFSRDLLIGLQPIEGETRRPFDDEVYRSEKKLMGSIDEINTKIRTSDGEFRPKLAQGSVHIWKYAWISVEELPADDTSRERMADWIEWGSINADLIDPLKNGAQSSLMKRSLDPPDVGKDFFDYRWLVSSSEVSSRNCVNSLILRRTSIKFPTVL